MSTIVIFHEVNDVDHWAASTKRAEVFGSRGIKVRTFVDPEQSNRVGLIVEVPDMAEFQALMESQEVADAMATDGVRPETVLVLTES